MSEDGAATDGVAAEADDPIALDRTERLRRFQALERIPRPGATVPPSQLTGLTSVAVPLRPITSEPRRGRRELRAVVALVLVVVVAASALPVLSVIGPDDARDHIEATGRPVPPLGGADTAPAPPAAASGPDGSGVSPTRGSAGAGSEVVDAPVPTAGVPGGGGWSAAGRSATAAAASTSSSWATGGGGGGRSRGAGQATTSTTRAAAAPPRSTTTTRRTGTTPPTGSLTTTTRPPTTTTRPPTTTTRPPTTTTRPPTTTTTWVRSCANRLPQGRIAPSESFFVFDGQSNSLAPSWREAYPTKVIARRFPEQAGQYQVAAVAGTTFQERSATAPQRVDSFVGRRPRTVVFSEGGQSDLFEGASGSELYERARRYHEARRAAGASIVVGATIPPATAFDASMDRARREYNALLRSDCYGAGLDVVVDVAALPELQDPTDTRYYSDGLHVTSTATDRMVDLYVWALP